MSRRNKERCQAIHVTLPRRLLEDFDETLGYEHSRSKKIAWLIENYMKGDRALVHESTTRQLMRAITNRDDCDDTMKVLLLQVLSQSS